MRTNRESILTIGRNTIATEVRALATIEKRLDVENDLKAVLEEILGEFGYSTADKME
jgi:hypothetical protein